jgi:Flp pilus assembly protein TadB
MSLSPHEQYQLSLIERGLRDQDPDFAAKLTSSGAHRSRHQSLAVAHGCLWLGMFLTLVGFAVVHEVLLAGVLMVIYGMVFLVYAIARILVLSPPTFWFPRQQ